MNLRFLDTFVGIADAGGIGRACERLHLSQPAASRRIVALENELGVQLFDRSAGRMQLTAAGEDLLRRSRRLLAEAQSLRDRARALAGGHGGILRIGCTPQVIEAFIAAFIAQYQARHPEVELRLVEAASGALPAQLERGDIDFAQIPAGDERFRWRLLYPTHAVAVFPSKHAMARGKAIDIKDLGGEPLLLLPHESQARGWMDAAFNVARLRPHIAHQSAVPHTLIALAAAGHGIAVVPSNLLIPQKGIAARPVLLRGQPVGRWSSIAWHPQRFLPPYAERFLEAFVRYAERADPGRRFTRRAPPLPRPKEPA